jgi:hypothetical protein
VTCGIEAAAGAENKSGEEKGMLEWELLSF